jgi:drug/metabolite transporter (DMT)-like permease
MASTPQTADRAPTPPPAGGVDPRTQLIACGALVFTSLLWGSMVPLTAVALAGYDIYLLSAIRYTIGVAVLIGVMLLFDRRIAHFHRLPWRRIVICGIAAGMFVTLATISIALSDPITVSAMFAAAPLVAVLMARMEQHVSLSRPVVIGLVAAVVGGILVALGQPGAAGEEFGLKLNGAEIIIIVAMAVWTWYSLKTQKWLAPTGLSQIQLTVLTLAFATLLLWIIYAGALAVGAIEPTYAVPALPQTLAMLWLAIGPTATAVLLWNYGNSKVGVTIATLMINLAPIFSVLIAMAFGYLPTLLQIVGGTIVLAGVVWMQVALMKRPAPAR